MPKKSDVTYQMVKTVADRLYEEGTRPTNERVRSETGGGSDIVAAHLRRWWDEHRRIMLLKSTTLDDCIKVAIHEEINRHVAVHTDSLNDLLKHEREANSALERQISELNQNIEDLESSGRQATIEHQQIVIALEKKNTASETKLKELESHHTAITEELRISNLKLIELERDNGKKEEQIKSLNAQLDKSNQDLSEKRDKLQESEKDLAVAQVRLETLNKPKSNKK